MAWEIRDGVMTAAGVRRDHTIEEAMAWIGADMPWARPLGNGLYPDRPSVHEALYMLTQCGVPVGHRRDGPPGTIVEHNRIIFLGHWSKKRE